MTNKLVVIINSLKVPKIKKIVLYEMKFLVWNYSWLQNPTRGLPPPDPRSLCPLSSTEFVEPPPPNKIPGYATALWTNKWQTERRREPWRCWQHPPPKRRYISTTLHFITPQKTAITADKPKDTQGYIKHSYPTLGNHISCQRPRWRHIVIMVVRSSGRARPPRLYLMAGTTKRWAQQRKRAQQS